MIFDAEPLLGDPSQQQTPTDGRWLADLPDTDQNRWMRAYGPPIDAQSPNDHPVHAVKTILAQSSKIVVCLTTFCSF